MDHPLVSHKLTLLRSVDTPSPVFRQLVEELVTLMAYEGTREVRIEPTTVTTNEPRCAEALRRPSTNLRALNDRLR